MTNDYSALFRHYISLTKEFSFKDMLEKSTEYTLEVFDRLSEEKGNYRYDEGKWTIAQLLSHVVDTERIMAYRAIRFARQDKTQLEGFDENLYVQHSGADKRTIDSLVTEFKALRNSTKLLYESFTDEMLPFYGSLDQQGLTVEKIGRMIAGHSMHHCNVLMERYGI